MTFLKKLQLLFLISFCFSLSCDAGFCGRLFGCFSKAKIAPEENINLDQLINNKDIKNIIENPEYEKIRKTKKNLNKFLKFVENSQIDAGEKERAVNLLKTLGGQLDKISALGRGCCGEDVYLCRIMGFVISGVLLVASIVVLAIAIPYLNRGISAKNITDTPFCEDVLANVDFTNDHWCYEKYGDFTMDRWLNCDECIMENEGKNFIYYSIPAFLASIGFLGAAAIYPVRFLVRKFKKWSLNRLITKLEKLLESKEFELVDLGENV